MHGLYERNKEQQSWKRAQLQGIDQEWVRECLKSHMFGVGALVEWVHWWNGVQCMLVPAACVPITTVLHYGRVKGKEKSRTPLLLILSNRIICQLTICFSFWKERKMIISLLILCYHGARGTGLILHWIRIEA